MALKDLIKKNPIEKLSSRDLRDEESRLKFRMELLRKDINTIEKGKKQKFQEGIGADMMKKKMLAQEISQLDMEARLKFKNFKTINKQYTFISNLIVVKNYEQDLKKNKIWDKINSIGPEKFRVALDSTNLEGKDFDEVLNDLNMAFEIKIMGSEAEEDEAENGIMTDWLRVESGEMEVDEVEQTLSLEKSLEKEKKEKEL